MILPDRDSIKSRLIQIFRTSPVLSAQALHERLRKGGKPCTLQAVYKELRALGADGIVQKIGGAYAINGTWALQFQAFATGLAKTCFNQSSIIPVLAIGEAQSWKFSSLLDLNDFWAHMVMHLARQSEDRTIYAWNPHLWFYFFQAEKEERFAKSLRLMGTTFCMLIGGKSFLNLWAEQFLKPNRNIRYAWGPGPFRDQMHTNYNIIGDHIITVRLSAKTFQTMDQLYRTTTKFENLDLARLAQLLSKEGHCTIKLEHNPLKAARLRQKLQNLF